MAYERDPLNPASFDNRGEPHSAARIDNELQPDPELAEGRSGGTRTALFAVAIAVVLGAVFYGLNNTTTDPAGKQAAQTTAPVTTGSGESAPPAAKPQPSQAANEQVTPGNPAIRDVTPRNLNTTPGTTTGSASGGAMSAPSPGSTPNTNAK